MDYSTKISAARYECVVCHLKSVTIAELHRHQTYQHTTEELSLSTIGLRSSLNNGPIKNDDTTYARSWLCDPQKRFEFYAYSARLLDDPNNNANFDRCVPLDCALGKRVKSKVKLAKTAAEKNAQKRMKYQYAVQEKKAQKLAQSKQAKNARLRRALNSGVLDLSCGKTLQEKIQREIPTSMDTSEDVFENIGDRKTALKINSKAPKKTKKPTEKKTIQKRELPKSQTMSGEFLKILADSKDNREEDDGENGKNEAEREERVKPKHAAKRKLRPGLRALPKSAKMRKIDSDSEEDDYERMARTRPKTYGNGKKKTARKRKASSRRVAVASAKRVRKIVSESEDQEEMSASEYFENSAMDENCVDRNCLDAAEDSLVYTENSVNLELPMHPQNEIPDVGQEVYVDNTCCDSSPVQLDESKIENFEKAEYFAPYPQNIDERSILVLDPTACKLVWTSFEVINDSTSGNNDDDRQDYDSLVVDDYVVTEYTRSSSSLSMKSPKKEYESIGSVYHQDQWEANQAGSENEENLANTYLQISAERTYVQSILTSRLQGPLTVNLHNEENIQSQDISYQRESETNETTLENEENLADTNFSIRSERTILSDPLSVKSDQEEDTSNRDVSSNQRQMETNEMVLKNNKKLPDKNFPCRYKRIKFTPQSSWSLKSDQEADTSSQEMPQKYQPETNENLSVEEENFGEAYFPLRSKRNRNTPNRYVPF